MRPAPSRLAFLAALAVVAGATACSREVRVGAIVSTSGPASGYGEKVARGIEVARRDLDARSAWFGRRYKILPADDATLPSRGVAALRDLAERERVRIVIGAVTSSVTIALGPECENRGIVLVSPTASAPEIASAGDFVFRVVPSDTLEGISMADFARDLGLSRIAVVTVSGAYGEGLRAAFVRHFEGPRRVIAGSISFTEADDDFLNAMAGEVATLRPDGVYLGAYEAEAAAIATHLRRAGFGGVLLGNSSLGAAYVERAGEAAEGTVFPKPVFDPTSTDPETRAFVERYREAYGETPDAAAAQGHDALKVIARAVDDAGSAEPVAVRAALAAIRDHVGAAGRVGFDANGDITRYPRLYVIRRGVPVPYENFVEQGGSMLGSAR